MAYPRKSPELKIISGSRQPDPKTTDAPPADQVLIEVPPAPDYLRDDALVEWNRAARILVERGLLDEIRIPLLAMYCAILGKCQMKLKAGDVPTAHLIQQSRTLARELGITGATADSKASDADRKPNRWAKIRERANKPD